MKSFPNAIPILVGLAALLPNVSSAKEGVGTHGGNAEVCFSDPTIADTLTMENQRVSRTIPDKYIPFIKSITTLDLAEALDGQHGEAAKDPIPIRAGEAPEAYADRIAGRFPGWTFYLGSSDAIGAIARDGRKLILEIQHVPDASLFPQDDIDPMRKAHPGCVYTTMAKQANIGFSKGKKLYIDDRLYLHKNHGEQSKGALWLHERVLAKLGPIAGTTEAVRDVSARMMGSDVTLSEMGFVLGRFDSADSWKSPIPESVDLLVSRLGATLFARYESKLKEANLRAGTEFETRHGSPMPFLAYQKATLWSFVEYKRSTSFDIYSCEGANAFLAEMNERPISAKTCAKLKELSAGRARAIQAAEAAVTARFRDAEDAGWTEVIDRTIAQLPKLRLTDAQHARLSDALRAWKTPSEKRTMEDFGIPADEIRFPAE